MSIPIWPRDSRPRFLQSLFVANAAIFSFFMLASAKPAAAQLEAQTRAVKCMKREARLKPPNVVMPTRRAANGKEEEYKQARHLKPVCPEGDVPVIVAPNKRHFPKGNPMLGNYSAPGTAKALPKEMVNHLLLP